MATRDRLFPDPRAKPNPGQADIDFTHPLAPEFCAIFYERAGLVTVDHASGVRGTFTNTPTWTKRVGYEGMGVDFAGSAYVAWAGLPDAPFLGPITLVWRGIIDNYADYRTFMIKGNGAGATQCPFSFWIEPFTPNVTFARSMNSNTREFTTPAPAAGAVHQFAVTTPTSEINFAPTFYVDTTQSTGVDTFGGGSGPATGVVSDLRIGRRGDNLQQMIGACEYALIYSRALSMAEIGWLFAEPYCYWRPILRRQYTLTIAAGTAKPALYYAAMRRA